jgi:hypothetical protein
MRGWMPVRVRSSVAFRHRRRLLCRNCFPDESELTAVYRMAKRPHVSELGLLRPHVEATVARCAAVGEVLVLHDTTEFEFAAGGGRVTREHLSLLSGRRQGFYTHVSLAVSDGPLSVPLGVLHLQPYVHRSQVGDANAGVVGGARWLVRERA